MVLAREEPRLTELNAGVGRRERFLCHAPVEGVTVAIIRVEEGGEVPERNTSSCRAGPKPAVSGLAARGPREGEEAPGVCPSGA